MNIVLMRYHQSRIEKLSFRQAPLSTYTYIYIYICISIDVFQNRYHFFPCSTTPVIIRRNSILAMSDRFNWLEIIQLLIYCPTLIDWKLFGIVIGESFMRMLFLFLSLSLFSIQTKKFMAYTYFLTIFSQLYRQLSAFLRNIFFRFNFAIRFLKISVRRELCVTEMF